MDACGRSDFVAHGDPGAILDRRRIVRAAHFVDDAQRVDWVSDRQCRGGAGSDFLLPLSGERKRVSRRKHRAVCDAADCGGAGAGDYFSRRFAADDSGSAGGLFSDDGGDADWSEGYRSKAAGCGEHVWRRSECGASIREAEVGAAVDSGGIANGFHTCGAGRDSGRVWIGSALGAGKFFAGVAGECESSATAGNWIRGDGDRHGRIRNICVDRIANFGSDGGRDDCGEPTAGQIAAGEKYSRCSAYCCWQRRLRCRSCCGGRW